MTISELKLRLNTSLNGLIDTYFGNANVTERMINATLKVLVKQNINKADKAMMLFADENGEICPKEILQNGKYGIIDINLFSKQEPIFASISFAFSISDKHLL